MSLPGFSAQGSLYRTNKTYRATYGIAEDSASATVIPQMLQCKCIRWQCLEWEEDADAGFTCLRQDCIQYYCYNDEPRPTHVP
jgi:hypothetical protein